MAFDFPLGGPFRSISLILKKIEIGDWTNSSHIPRCHPNKSTGETKIWNRVL